MTILRLLLAMSATALVGFSCMSEPADAKAYYPSRREMVQRADVIAIVDIGPVNDKAEVQGKHWSFSEKATGTVERLITAQPGHEQGLAPGKELTLVAGENFTCARNQLASGRALVFLTQDGQIYSGAAWNLSFLLVDKDNQLSWPGTAEGRHADKKATSLNQVLADIKTDLAAPPDLTYQPTYLQELYASKRFCDGSVGESPKEAPEYTAYVQACNYLAESKHLLPQFCRNASPAGKLYGACLLYKLDKDRGRAELKLLSTSTEPVAFASGCEVMTLKVKDIAAELLKSHRYGSIHLDKGKLP